MGEIADMMLEGLLDVESGEYIGDINKRRFGTEAPGFPVSYEREERERHQQPNPNKTKGKKYQCPLCNRLVARNGLQSHVIQLHKELSLKTFNALKDLLIAEAEKGV